MAATASAAQAPGPRMPDPKQMSGVPLPTADLPVGTITVRVIRGSLSSPVPGQQVDLVGDVQTSARTNDSGRAQFSNLKPGAAIRAATIVDGEKLESQQIRIPNAGGVRIMLVATDPEAAHRAEEDRRLAQGPAQKGMVVLGDESRFVFELGETGLNAFYILHVLNTARVPVEPPMPVAFELPIGAEGAAILDGSSPLASVMDDRVHVKGPFPPGITLVQFAYTVPYARTLSVRQVLPAQLARLTVVVQKSGDLRMTSSQIAQQREMSTGGQTFIVGQGPAVALGSAVEFSFSGLPYAPTWPRNVALALALLILGAGAVVAVRGRSPAPADARRRHGLNRERLFEELMTLEKAHRNGRIDPSTHARLRKELVASLERIYAALDEDRAA